MTARHVGVALAVRGRVAEVAPAVDHLLRRAAADPELQPAAGDDVRRAGVLSHVQRVLVAHVDHGRPDLDRARSRADGRKQRERRAELAGEMVHAEVRAVGAQLLGSDGELDRLEQRIGRGAYPASRTSHSSARTTGTRSSSNATLYQQTPTRVREDGRTGVQIERAAPSRRQASALGCINAFVSVTTRLAISNTGAAIPRSRRAGTRGISRSEDKAGLVKEGRGAERRRDDADLRAARQEISVNGEARFVIWRCGRGQSLVDT